MATLEERVVVLEAMVHELRTQLERPHRDSMSRTRTCPCCGGGTMLLVREINEHGHNGLVPLAIGNRGRMFVQGMGSPLHAYVCKSCLYVEWYVAWIDNIVVNGQTVIELTRPEEAAPKGDAPYR